MNSYNSYNPRYRTVVRKRKRSKALMFLFVLVLVGVVVGGSYTGAQLFAPNDTTTLTQTSEPAQSTEATQSTNPDIIMTLPGSADTYVLKGENYLEAGCKATSKTEGNITSNVSTSGRVDTTKTGTYPITYTAKTKDGKTATATRNVHVVDAFPSGKAATSLPMLMYHYVYTASAPPAEMNNNYILDTDLAEQLDYLTKQNYYYPSFQEVRAFAEGTHSLPAKSVVLTFDDGERGFLTHGIPVLERYKVPATSFVICTDLDAAEKVQTFASSYVNFQSHSYGMHQPGSNIGRGGIIHAMTEDEIVADNEKAAAILGKVDALAYPFGDNNETAHAALQKAGLLCAFTIVNDRISPGDNPYALNRVRISGEYSLDSFATLVAGE